MDTTEVVVKPFVFDLDYGNRLLALTPTWDGKWEKLPYVNLYPFPVKRGELFGLSLSK